MIKPISLKEENKPTIFVWGDYREKSYHLKNKLSYENLTLFHKLFDTIYEIVQTKSINESSLLVFKSCLTSKVKLLWETSGKWVMQFKHYFEEFYFLISELMTYNISVRLHIIQSIWDYIPNENTLFMILNHGLKDKNKKVRLFTISRIRMLKRLDFLQKLKELPIEEDLEIKLELACTISLFENGFWIKDELDNRATIMFMDKNKYTYFHMDNLDLSKEKILNEIEKIKSCNKKYFLKDPLF